MIAPVAFVCVGLVTTGVLQSDLRPVVEQALDQPMELMIESVPVTQAFAIITDQTGIVVTADPGAVDLLPYGRATQVTAEIRNISLREGLGRLLAPLGMRFEVTDNGIRVFPAPALKRLGRRATWPELRVLEWLHTARLDSEGVLDGLRTHVQFQVPDADPWAKLAAASRKVGAGAGDQVLDIACRSLGWTWYPSGEQIVVAPLAEQVRRQLQARLSIRKSHRPLLEILREVARQAGVNIRLGDGVAAALPVQTRRSFTLFADNVTAEEALEEIAAAIALSYRVQAEGVVFTLPDGGAGAQKSSAMVAGAARHDPYVAKITLPAAQGAYQVEFLLRESDLSPEVNELRNKLIDEADEAIKQMLRKRFEVGEEP